MIRLAEFCGGRLGRFTTRLPCETILNPVQDPMPIFSWWKTRRRKKLLAEPFPETWLGWLTQLWFYPRLSSAQQESVRRVTRVMVAEKNWEGLRGLEMTDEIRVTIAAQAGWLTCGMTDQFFDRVQSILVYPDAYVAPGQILTKGGIVLEGESPRVGEAWYRGPVILAWDDVRRGGASPNHGHNLVLHEFAHQLDMLNGADADGVPVIEEQERADRWLGVTEKEYQRLCRDCDAGRHTLLDCYGTTNKAEFFAVATEGFFQLPRKIQHHHPELYAILSDFYNYDPLRLGTF